jgi:hypothetical protein
MEKRMINTSRQLLKMLKVRKEQLNKEYEGLKPYMDILMQENPVKGSDRAYYYRKEKNGLRYRRTYIGSSNNMEVLNIKKARYIAKALEVVEKDIALLNSLCDGYAFTGFRDINESIPKTYRLQSLDYYENLPDVAREWLRRKEAEKAEYGPWHPEGLIHKVSNGIKVRTKSEMAIAEILLRNGIPFVYELPHVLKNGTIVHTDFTILSTIDYKTEILLEHEGSMADSGYRDKHSWRVENYYLSGYIPNVNIFFTYDGMNGSVDGEAIQRIVDGWLRPADDRT